MIIDAKGSWGSVQLDAQENVPWGLEVGIRGSRNTAFWLRGASRFLSFESVKILFLYGAGASYGSGPCHPNRPPLGNGPAGLFAELSRRATFSEVLPPILAPKFITNFEEAMSEWLEDGFGYAPARALAVIREMALFFLELCPLDNNLYIRFADLIARTRADVALATLNYDLLLELALERVGFRVRSLHDAASLLPTGAPGVPVLPIHGACNLVPSERQDVRYVGGMMTQDAVLYDGPISRVSLAEAIERCRTEGCFPPALAFFTPNKRTIVGARAFQERVEQWHSLVAWAEQIVIVGVHVNPNDKHIWEVLGMAAAPILDCDPSPEAFEDWSRKLGRTGDRILRGTFEEAFPRIEALLQRPLWCAR